MLTRLPLQLHGVWLAIEASHVQEIVSGRAWVALPGASAEVPGVLAWRGRAIGVLDLGPLVDTSIEAVRRLAEGA
jgi:chemotaxis signal transduction protein